MASTRESLAGLAARRVRAEGTARCPPALLLHGIGLGAWIWRRDQDLLAREGVESVAVDLPGHGPGVGQDVGLGELVEAVEGAARALGDEPVLVGHSMGALVAQLVAARLRPAAMVLVAAVPPREVRWWPTPSGVRGLVPELPRLAAGRALRPGLRVQEAAGLRLLPEAERGEVLGRLTPWPARLVRDLGRRPGAPPAACPTLLTHGFQDRVASLQTARLLADYHGGILWRFDDLAHFPMLEPGGARHARAVAEWLRAPRGRRVLEVDPLGPREGVGEQARAARRGDSGRSNSRFPRR